MNWRYWLALVLILLALPGCTPGALVSISNSTAASNPLTITPTPAVTSNSTAISDNSTAVFNPSDLVPRITIQYLLQKIKSGANILIIDTRIDVEVLFAQGHITGAVIVPLSQFLGGWIPAVPLNREIILY
jgi:hypothetical protein